MTERLTRTSLSKAAQHLAARDPDLARSLATHGVPPMWARRPGFETVVHIVLEQQVSLASAAAALRRLEAGVVPFTPGRFVALGESHLRALGITRQKAAYCLNIARAIHEKRIDLDALTRLDDASVRSDLTAIKGVGPWTADIYLLMALRRPDIWPSGDLALATAARAVKLLRARPAPAELARIAESWRPFRAVAARILWQHYLAGAAGRS